MGHMCWMRLVQVGGCLCGIECRGGGECGFGRWAMDIIQIGDVIYGSTAMGHMCWMRLVQVGGCLCGIECRGGGECGFGAGGVGICHGGTGKFKN